VLNSYKPRLPKGGQAGRLILGGLHASLLLLRLPFYFAHLGPSFGAGPFSLRARFDAFDLKSAHLSGFILNRLALRALNDAGSRGADDLPRRCAFRVLALGRVRDPLTPRPCAR
jgi:hypothetical protein